MLSSLGLLETHTHGASDTIDVTERERLRMQKRLLVFFDPEHHFVERFYEPFNFLIHSPRYTIKLSTEYPESWELYAGNVEKGGSGDVGQNRLIRIEPSLNDLAAWIFYNHLLHEDTRVIFMGQEGLLAKNLRMLCEECREQFGAPLLPGLESEVFDSPAVPLRFLLVFNLLSPRELTHSLAARDARQEERRSSGRFPAVRLDSATLKTIADEELHEIGGPRVATGPNGESVQAPPDFDSLPIRAGKLVPGEDPLNAGPFKSNILCTLFLYEKNSWGQLLVKEYSGRKSLPLCLANALSYREARPLQAYVGDGPYDHSYAKRRLRTLIQSVQKHFAPAKAGRSFVMEVDGTHFALTQQGNKVVAHESGDLNRALAAATLIKGERVNIAFDTA
ncbi:MAG: hypothetical protein HQL31_12745, partial [Planctomycetes bacterium]|nr:hypothetical protein [Planctomycetota bacterium]